MDIYIYNICICIYITRLEREHDDAARELVATLELQEAEDDIYSDDAHAHLALPSEQRTCKRHTPTSA